MLGVLARRYGSLEPDEREAIFHDAYTLMLEKDRNGSLDLFGMNPYQVRAYLTQTAVNKALDEGKRAERNRTEPIGERALAEPDFSLAPDEAAAATLESAVVREIVDELPERRQAVIKLRFFFEQTPAEIQQTLKISSRVYRRELERGIQHICKQYELVRAGLFCDTRQPLIMSYVAGTATEREGHEARKHLAHCLGCASWAAELRVATRDVAAALPVPAVVLEGRGGSRLAEAVSAVHDAAAQMVVGAKQHATALAARLDSGAAGYATAARPGTIAAVVTGCIAVGGGATYCAVQGVNDVRAIFVDEQTRTDERKRPNATAAKDRRQDRRPARSVNVITDSSAPATEAQAPPRAQPGQRKAADHPVKREAAAAAEFGIQEPAETRAPISSSSTAPAPPPPTSSDTLGSGVGGGSPGEFDP